MKPKLLVYLMNFKQEENPHLKFLPERLRCWADRWGKGGLNMPKGKLTDVTK